MQLDNLLTVFLIIGFASTVFYGMYWVSRYAFIVNFIMLGVLVFYLNEETSLVLIVLYLFCPLTFINVVMYVFLYKTDRSKKGDIKYRINFPTTKGNFKLENIKRGASVIGSAGSGKTESVVYGFLKHFRKEGFCGIIHDYKDFELTPRGFYLFVKMAKFLNSACKIDKSKAINKNQDIFKPKTYHLQTR